MERQFVPLPNKYARPIVFSIAYGWFAGCLYQGMTLTLILVAVQVVVTLVAMLRENAKDTRFDGDKLNFRS